MPAGGIRFDIKVDTTAAMVEFAEARRQINGQVKAGLLVAAQKVALPEAKHLAPVKTGRLQASLVAKASSRSAYLTTSLRGKQGRYVGLQEFGGTVSAPIVPKNKRAVVVNGQPVARVSGPRTYQAKRFLTRAVQRRRTEIALAIRDETLKAFKGFEIT